MDPEPSPPAPPAGPGPLPPSFLPPALEFALDRRDRTWVYAALIGHVLLLVLAVVIAFAAPLGPLARVGAVAGAVVLPEVFLIGAAVVAATGGVSAGAKAV